MFECPIHVSNLTGTKCVGNKVIFQEYINPLTGNVTLSFDFILWVTIIGVLGLIITFILSKRTKMRGKTDGN